MAGIWNINSLNNLNSKKIINKLSFELGEEFLARIVDVDILKNEVLLKMLDGWQFKAELKNHGEKIPEGILRFKVEGFEDGKLKIMVLNQEKDPEREISNLLKTLEKQNIEVSKDDFMILDKMIKHSMALTRQKISDVKSIFEFKAKIENSPEEVDNFINKFLETKGIDGGSKEGRLIQGKLKTFFQAFKNVTENDILTFMENDIEINHDNLKSFERVFKESQAIYKQLEVFSRQLEGKPNKNQDNGRVHSKSINVDEQTLESIKIQGQDLKEETVSGANFNNGNVKNETIKTEAFKVLSHEENANNQKQEVQNSKDSLQKDGTVISKEIKGKIDTQIKPNDLQILSDIIKEEIKSNSNSVKNVVMDIISNMKEGEESTKETILNFLRSSGNDFKVLNTVSNQYYYFDLPLKVQDHDYGCKLIIKDERKKGKKIDSNDVKIAASINTENMGTVDSYISVKNYNMSIEIKSEEKFIKLINGGKEILLKELSNLGYNISVKVDKRIKAVSISDSRDFFQDNDLVNINVRV